MLLDPNAIQASQLQNMYDILNRFGQAYGTPQQFLPQGPFTQPEIFPNLLDPTLGRGRGAADLLADSYQNILRNPSDYLQTAGEVGASRGLQDLIGNTPNLLSPAARAMAQFGVSPLISQAAGGLLGAPGTSQGLIGEATGVNRQDPLTQLAGGLAAGFPTQNALDPTAQGTLSGFLTGGRQQQDLMRLEDALRARSDRSGERERQRLAEGTIARPGLFGGMAAGTGTSPSTGIARNPRLLAIASEMDRLRNESLENQLAGLEVDLARQGRGESLQALGLSPSISELPNQRLAQQIGLLSGVGGQQFRQPLEALQFALGASGIPLSEAGQRSALLGQLGNLQTGLGMDVIRNQFQLPLSAISQQQSALGQLANQEGVFSPRILQALGLAGSAVQGPFRGIFQMPAFAPSQAMQTGIGGIGGLTNPFGGLTNPFGMPNYRPSQQTPFNQTGPTPGGRDARLRALEGGGGGPYLGGRGYWEQGTGNITMPGDAGASGNYSLDPRLSDPYEQGLTNDPYGATFGDYGAVPGVTSTVGNRPVRGGFFRPQPMAGGGGGAVAPTPDSAPPSTSSTFNPGEITWGPGRGPWTTPPQQPAPAPPMTNPVRYGPTPTFGDPSRIVTGPEWGEYQTDPRTGQRVPWGSSPSREQQYGPSIMGPGGQAQPGGFGGPDRSHEEAMRRVQQNQGRTGPLVMGPLQQAASMFPTWRTQQNIPQGQPNAGYTPNQIANYQRAASGMNAPQTGGGLIRPPAITTQQQMQQYPHLFAPDAGRQAGWHEGGHTSPGGFPQQPVAPQMPHPMQWPQPMGGGGLLAPVRKPWGVM